jgi:hypothetical protein
MKNMNLKNLILTATVLLGSAQAIAIWPFAAVQSKVLYGPLTRDEAISLRNAEAQNLIDAKEAKLVASQKAVAVRKAAQNPSFLRRNKKVILGTLGVAALVGTAVYAYKNGYLTPEALGNGYNTVATGFANALTSSKNAWSNFSMKDTYNSSKNALFAVSGVLKNAAVVSKDAVCAAPGKLASVGSSLLSKMPEMKMPSFSMPSMSWRSVTPAAPVAPIAPAAPTVAHNAYDWVHIDPSYLV